MNSEIARQGRSSQISRVAAVKKLLVRITPLLILCLIQSNAQPGTLATQKYQLDPGQSRFMVLVKVGGLLSAFGHDHNIAIKDFTGDAIITETSVSPAALRLNIKAASLFVTDKVSASDKQKIEATMRDEALETGKYPEIAFQSTSIDVKKLAEGQYEAGIWGDLSLHGVTKRIWFPAKVTLSGPGLRATGSFTIKQSDFGMKLVSAGGGTVKVKNDLKLSFEIVGKRT